MGIKAAMGVARGIGKAIGGVTSFGADTLEAIFKKFSFGFGGEKSYDELVTIRKILDERLTNPRKKKKKIKAFQIKKNGKGYEELQVNEATVPVKELLGISREKGVSMSVLLTTAFICAIHEEMSRIQEKLIMPSYLHG